MQVLIPMAGRGARFIQAGYTFPKPLIDVNGRPMIEVVVNNLDLDGKYIFLCLKEHYDNYSLGYMLPLICKPNPSVVKIVDTVTEGAACTVLLAKSLLDPSDELIIANSDQWIDWHPPHFLEFVRNRTADGAILTFHSTHPKWSFARVDELSNRIVEVAEKRPISTNATVGVYYFRHASDFVWAAEQMISKNTRVNGEFYLCPVYNELIDAGKVILNYPVAEMRGLGTPEDLQAFLRR